MGQWGQFFIVDKPYKNMGKPWNAMAASEEKGVLGQMGIMRQLLAGMSPHLGVNQVRRALSMGLHFTGQED